MLGLAGEIGDGVMGWLCNPSYIRDVVVPAVRARREHAGHTMEVFEIVAAVPGALTDDLAGAYEAIRGELLTYFWLPFYRRCWKTRATVRTSLPSTAAQGDAAAMRQAISDDFLDALTAVGDEPAVRSGVERYRDAGATVPCVGPISRTDFDATLRARVPGR